MLKFAVKLAVLNFENLVGWQICYTPKEIVPLEV
jgi:hypothetical protein